MAALRSSRKGRHATTLQGLEGTGLADGVVELIPTPLVHMLRYNHIATTHAAVARPSLGNGPPKGPQQCERLGRDPQRVRPCGGGGLGHTHDR